MLICFCYKYLSFVCCLSDELDPIQATTFEEYSKEDNWEQAGFEESFDVEWTQANYSLPHVGTFNNAGVC